MDSDIIYGILAIIFGLLVLIFHNFFMRIIRIGHPPTFASRNVKSAFGVRIGKIVIYVFGIIFILFGLGLLINAFFF